MHPEWKNFMKHYNLPIVIKKDADGYFAQCPALQGCYTQGDTYEEVLTNIKDAIGLHIEDWLAQPNIYESLE